MTEQPPRRVVTGHDELGASIVLSDGNVPMRFDIPDDGVTLFETWRTIDMPATIASRATEMSDWQPEVTPSERGTLLRIVDLQPGAASPMHRTESIDYGIVLKGQISMCLDGSELELNAGDVVIQRGTDHAWINRSDESARIAFVLVSGRFDQPLQELLGSEALDGVWRNMPLGS